jgi:hypothetical protein
LFPGKLSKDSDKITLMDHLFKPKNHHENQQEKEPLPQDVLALSLRANMKMPQITVGIALTTLNSLLDHFRAQDPNQYQEFVEGFEVSEGDVEQVMHAMHSAHAAHGVPVAREGQEEDMKQQLRRHHGKVDTVETVHAQHITNYLEASLKNTALIYKDLFTLAAVEDTIPSPVGRAMFIKQVTSVIKDAVLRDQSISKSLELYKASLNPSKAAAMLHAVNMGASGIDTLRISILDNVKNSVFAKLDQDLTQKGYKQELIDAVKNYLEEDQAFLPDKLIAD